MNINSLIVEIEKIKASINIENDLVVIKDAFNEMAQIWIDLKPAEDVVRKLFPQLNGLFDILDEIAALDQKILNNLK